MIQNNLLAPLRRLAQEILSSITTGHQRVHRYRENPNKNNKQAKPSSCHLHMSNVHSSRIIKMAQLLPRLSDQLIKRINIERKIKLKIVTKLAYFKGRRWWLAIGSDSLLAHKTSWKKGALTDKELDPNNPLHLLRGKSKPDGRPGTPGRGKTAEKSHIHWENESTIPLNQTPTTTKNRSRAKKA